jgi:hypothetical protein
VRFSVGYPIVWDSERHSFADLLKPFVDHVSEVYFAWPGEPSGRMPYGASRGSVDWSAQTRLEEDLSEIDEMGISLNLLLNANCYGPSAISEQLANTVLSIVNHIKSGVHLPSITTTSPFIAGVIKENSSDIDVRASVNMRIGDIQGMEYLSSTFDGFYVRKEVNRDVQRIAEMKAWCDRNGKSLHMLANSGCLAFCSTQTFHDNMVAHERELASTVNLPIETQACRSYLADTANWAAVLAATWVRPEDIHRYEPYFDEVKLATRAHANPMLVLRAYIDGKYSGNLLDLLEPGHSEVFRDYVIENSLFPDDWFEVTTSCSHRCDGCDYCRTVLENVVSPRR